MEGQHEQSKPPLNRVRLQKLAERFLVDAENLISSERWAGAYYLAGYAVECALKACIAKQVRKHDFPDYRTVKEYYTHDLRKLLKLAGLQGLLEKRSDESDGFRKNWEEVVVNWNESSRYDGRTQALAKELLHAVRSSEEGVLPWLRRYW